MSDARFTGERLHAGSDLFRVDLARHHAAYRFAMDRAGKARVLDVGCGSGYGTHELATIAPFVAGLDRIAPDRTAREGRARFVRADVNAIPLASRSFDLVVSFQVIEHLEDPSPYLRSISRILRPGGMVLVSTPNRLTSDGENPYHVHEYDATELEGSLGAHFQQVELHGVHATGAIARYLESRLRRIRRITRLDPLHLRRRLPRPLVEWLFARFATVVRRGIQRHEGLPDAGWRDFPVGPVHRDCIDLLAVCRSPRHS